MTSHQSVSRVLMITALLFGGIHDQAKSTPALIDPSISRLASRIAEILRKAHAKKVVVAELRGPDGQMHPVGEHLADRLTESLQKEFPDLEVIDRSQQKANTSDYRDSKNKSAALDKKAKAWARSLGAKFIITGSFAKVSQGIGVSLSAMLSNDSSSRLGVTNGLVPITDEIMVLSSDPIPSPKNGIPEAGVGGTTVPTCVHCPAPDYTSSARAAKLQGVVILDVVVNPDGQTGQITVVDPVSEWKRVQSRPSRIGSSSPH